MAALRGEDMSTLDELRRNIARITRCSEQEITPETALKDIKADSLHWVQIIVGVENALDIENICAAVQGLHEACSGTRY